MDARLSTSRLAQTSPALPAGTAQAARRRLAYGQPWVNKNQCLPRPYLTRN